MVGYVARETPSTGYYVRCYLVLDFSIHKLRVYPEEAEQNSVLVECDAEINCQYITKVRASLTRPKALNSLGKQPLDSFILVRAIPSGLWCVYFSSIEDLGLRKSGGSGEERESVKDMER